MIALFSKKKCQMRYDASRILAAVTTGGTSLSKIINATIEDLCKCTYFERIVFKYVLTNGGTRTKAEEILEEGLIKTSELMRQGKYQGGSIVDFAIGICKKLWLNMRRKKDEQLHLTGDLSTIDSVEPTTAATNLEAEEKKNILLSILKKCVEKDCLELFQLKYIEGERHEKIVEKLGLTSVDSSKQKLSYCKKKAVNYLREHPAYLTLLASVDVHLKNW